MRAVFVSAAVAITFLLAVSVAQDGRKVEGVVVAAATQQPVANARVRYEESGSTPRTTVTDSKGFFEIDGIRHSAAASG